MRALIYLILSALGDNCLSEHELELHVQRCQEKRQALFNEIVWAREEIRRRQPQSPVADAIEQ